MPTVGQDAKTVYGKGKVVKVNAESVVVEVDGSRHKLSNKQFDILNGSGGNTGRWADSETEEDCNVLDSILDSAEKLYARADSMAVRADAARHRDEYDKDQALQYQANAAKARADLLALPGYPTMSPGEQTKQYRLLEEKHDGNRRRAFASGRKEASSRSDSEEIEEDCSETDASGEGDAKAKFAEAETALKRGDHKAYDRLWDEATKIANKAQARGDSDPHAVADAGTEASLRERINHLGRTQTDPAYGRKAKEEYKNEMYRLQDKLKSMSRSDAEDPVVEFCKKNPGDPRVKKIMKAMNSGSLSMHSDVGKLIGEISREVGSRSDANVGEQLEKIKEHEAEGRSDADGDEWTVEYVNSADKTNTVKVRASSGKDAADRVKRGLGKEVYRVISTKKTGNPTEARERQHDRRSDADNKLSETERKGIGSVGSEHREEMPEDAFLEPGERKYPVKDKRDGAWVYDRKLLIAAEERAKQQGADAVAAKAKSILSTKFGGESDADGQAPIGPGSRVTHPKHGEGNVVSVSGKENRHADVWFSGTGKWERVKREDLERR